jgi:hypothetical protein
MSIVFGISCVFVSSNFSLFTSTVHLLGFLLNQLGTCARLHVENFHADPKQRCTPNDRHYSHSQNKSCRGGCNRGNEGNDTKVFTSYPAFLSVVVSTLRARAVSIPRTQYSLDVSRRTASLLTNRWVPLPGKWGHLTLSVYLGTLYVLGKVFARNLP